MLYFGTGKKLVIAAALLFGFLFSLPNFFYERAQLAGDARDAIEKAELSGDEVAQEWLEQASLWPSWLPGGVVRLGLDLQGGQHFLLEVQTDVLVRERMENVRQTIGRTLREADVRAYSNIEQIGDSVVQVRITNAEDVDRAQEALGALSQPISADLGGFFGVSQDLRVTAEDGQVIRIELTDEARDQIERTVVLAAIEVIRKRIDAYGTREPTIQRQGANRILVQLPGASNVDPRELTTVARLEFHMVAHEVTSSQVISGDIPLDVELVSYDERLNENTGFQQLPVRITNPPLLTGDQLADAYQGFDSRDGITEPAVFLRFNPAGARVFGRITSENLGRQFAMVLDGKILSAPVIQAAILNGSPVITGQFSVESARALAVNLQSGSLPAEITVEESSEVGPELGADSVAAGRIACIIGFLLVLVFMGVSYGMFGLFANIALIINVFLIFGALSAFGLTLTLPGIAGVVLTIGMAVDANVLVFERIREELKRGRNVAQAIETGYSRAFSAIIDANVTTFIAAVILFGMGAGPIRGFSVTLGVGIVTSVFTAVMLTRFFVATWYARARPKALVL